MMALSGSVGLATRSGLASGSAALGLRPRRRLPLARSSAARAAIFSCWRAAASAARRSSSALQARRRDRRSSRRQVLRSRHRPRADSRSSPIDRLRLGQHPPDLLPDRRGAAVRLQRGVGLHLRAVQNHQPEPDQPGVAAHLQHPEEDALQPLDMPSPEAGDHRVVRRMLADDEAIARVAPAQPLDRPLERTPWL